jgi:Zn-dependent membrane protease YugP
MVVPFVDSYYQLLVVPAIAFSGFIQMRMSATLKKDSGVAVNKGLTGRDAAVQILKLNGINDVAI